MKPRADSLPRVKALRLCQAPTTALTIIECGLQKDRSSNPSFAIMTWGDSHVFGAPFVVFKMRMAIWRR